MSVYVSKFTVHEWDLFRAKYYSLHQINKRRLYGHLGAIKGSAFHRHNRQFHNVTRVRLSSQIHRQIGMPTP